ncbi:hypothetical protein [Variovorax rhizosphaerae]|uniref:Uncharacterized protein n=1 Tax=Variovorax rhizosphaerae TaxID=1836200 RepID=A0ABU8WUF4_9BURK
MRIGLAETHCFLALYTLGTTLHDAEEPSRDGDRLMVPESMVLQLAERMVSESGVTHERMLYLMQISAKFKQPVQAGDTLVNRMHFKSKQLALQPGRGVVVTGHHVITDQGHLALEYEAVRMIRCRNAIDPATEPTA